VITHPEHRRSGIATRVMHELLHHCREHHAHVELVDGSGIEGFYERFGFEPADPATHRVLYWSAAVTR